MAVMEKLEPSPAYLDAVEEIAKIYRSLPPRPTIEEVEAAVSIIGTSSAEEHLRLKEISNQSAPQDVSPELVSVLQQVRKTMVLFRGLEQRKEATHLLELDRIHAKFDVLVQRASRVIYGDAQMGKEGDLDYPEAKFKGRVVIGGESLISPKKDGDGEGLTVETEVEEAKTDDSLGLVKSSSAKTTNLSSGETEKLSLMKVAALIEATARNGEQVLDFRGKLMDKIEWLPLSLGKLSNVTKLDFSKNKIMALPSTICSLAALTTLDLHVNQLVNLPDTFGQLLNLTHLDLHANRMKSLPCSFGSLKNLINLDLSSNYFAVLPDVIGNLTSLKMLRVEINELKELPYTIGSCSSLVELRLDFNQLKALPEALGKLKHLEILTLHYNRVRKLPTTMSSHQCLRELDFSFNELEAVLASLCFAVGLEKLNAGKNFADLRALPRSIGNLKNLEELDIRDDQIRVLPDSFRFLSKLRVFRADETPLEVPPREVTKLGAQAVVEYMADLVAGREVKYQDSKTESKKQKGFWAWICLLFCD